MTAMSTEMDTRTRTHLHSFITNYNSFINEPTNQPQGAGVGCPPCSHTPSESLTCVSIERRARDSGIVTSRHMFELILNIHQHMFTCILGLLVILDYVIL